MPVSQSRQRRSLFSCGGDWWIYFINMHGLNSCDSLWESNSISIVVFRPVFFLPVPLLGLVDLGFFLALALFDDSGHNGFLVSGLCLAQRNKVVIVEVQAHRQGWEVFGLLAWQYARDWVLKLRFCSSVVADVSAEGWFLFCRFFLELYSLEEWELLLSRLGWSIGLFLWLFLGLFVFVRLLGLLFF